MDSQLRPVDRRPRWPVLAVFAGIVVLQLAVAATSLDLLSGVRAYVAGESLYSKAQKDAQIHLLSYVEQQSEEDYRRFTRALAVPLGDRVAREALQKSEPDRAAARLGFLDGGNHPDDIDGMIRIFVWFHGLPLMAGPIATWTEGDAAIQQMRELAGRARQHIAARRQDALVNVRLEASILNDRLSALESRFSAELGETSRQTQTLLTGLNLGLAVCLGLTGLTFVRYSVRAQARTEEALRQHEESLRAGERHKAASSAKSDFLSRMSHELRTPLNAVIGFSQLLRLDPHDPPTLEQLERIEHIENAGTHLLALVNDVLDLSAVESGRLTAMLEPVNLRAAIGESAGMVDSLAQACAVQLVIDDRPPAAGEGAAADAHRDPWVRCDPVRLRQVMVNLLSNAVKYNRVGGSVTVSHRIEGDRCLVSIVDTGQGIAAQKLDRLFEPFNRLGAEQSKVEGTGIGLVLSRRLVEAMGGQRGRRGNHGDLAFALRRQASGRCRLPGACERAHAC